MRLRNSLITVALASILSTVMFGGTSITGRIHDLQGRPLKDVAITAEGNLKTISDEKGEFSIQPAASAGKLRILFESPGYYSETLLYEIKDPAARLDVMLTPRKAVREEVKVVVSRLDTPLAATPAATTVVGADELDTMTRSIAVDEALKFVPGVKVDNQANGERVHLSIRGQGILSERGIRGIQVLYDGLPLNDPSGFCPDLYDVDWAGVQEVNVVRGPVAFLYGGGSAGGVIDILTRATGSGPLHGGVWTEGGSNAFYKTRGEIAGSSAGVWYLISGSRTAGDGYREHQAFWGNNVYGRFGFNPTSRLRLNPFVIGTGFFNENSEGLNLSWPGSNWWTMANPDALTYNEYQRTLRVTGGFTGQWVAANDQLVSFTFYARRTAYKEPVPSSVEHRTMSAPGGSIQYAGDRGTGRIRHHFSAGIDVDGQFVRDLRHPNLGNAVEGPELLANQWITQHRLGGYATERLTLGSQWTLLGSVRYDRIGNKVEDSLKLSGLDLSGSQNFTKATGRLGATWNPTTDAGLFVSWGQGFLPPATEELYANPAALGGFNRSLVPATSMGAEVGARGTVRNRLFWEADFFRLGTKHDFERYRIPNRSLETFYANAGETRRYGFETAIKWQPVRRLTVNGAYTYSNFIYKKYTSLTYSGNLVGNYLPNSPRQQAFVAASCELGRGLTLGVSTKAYSRAFIDPTNKTWIDAYGLLDARLSKSWERGKAHGTFFVAASNLAGKDYIAFTEPDPDGNSYQPGPNREVFAGMQIRF